MTTPAILNAPTALTITSLQLVQLINNNRKEGDAELRHSDFLAKVPKVLGLEMNENFRSSYIDNINREKPCYIFPKREACLLAMSYSYDLQAKVYDYMTELENQQKSFKVPQTYAQALLEAGRLAVALEKAEQQLEEQKPKVEFATQLLQATNGIDFGTSAKAMLLPFGRNKLFEICRKEGWLFGKNQPKQHLVDMGYFVVLESSFIHPTTGDACATTKTLITPRGQEWLLKQLKKLGLIVKTI